MLFPPLLSLLIASLVSIGGIRTIPPGFTRGLDFGPQSESPQDGALLEEEVEEVEVVPIYRPMFDVKSDARKSSTVSLLRFEGVFFRSDDSLITFFSRI